jgi:hypothetical protein
MNKDDKNFVHIWASEPPKNIPLTVKAYDCGEWVILNATYVRGGEWENSRYRTLPEGVVRYWSYSSQ